jgi:hypothetical protein
LAVVTIVALVHRRPVLVRTAALAWLVYSVPHLVYHSAHLDLYDDTDVVLMIVSLAIAVVLPAWLFLGRRPVDGRSRRSAHCSGSRGRAHCRHCAGVDQFGPEMIDARPADNLPGPGIDHRD